MSTSVRTAMPSSSSSPSNLLLPPEMWEKIFLSISSLRDLLRSSNVCREFYRMIRNERFLKKYFHDGMSTLTRNLDVLCNFTSDIAVNNDDFLYNTKGCDANHPRTHVTGINPQIGTVDNRPCLIFPSDRPTYIQKRCNFNVTDSFTISFWLLLRNHSSYINLPLGFIFGHGKRYFLSFNFQLLPSGKFDTFFEFWNRRRQNDIVIAQQLQTNKWYHTVAIFSLSQSTIKFYLNANKTNEMKMPEKVDFNDHVLVRSCSAGVCIADVALWSRELSPMELQLIFRQNTPVDKTDMVQYILNTSNSIKDEMLTAASLKSNINVNSFQN